MERPEYLYKYQSLSIQSLKNLKRNCIYFNDPNNFNDPYDTNQKIEVESTNIEVLKLLNDSIEKSAKLDILINKLDNDSLSKGELIELIFEYSNRWDLFFEELLYNLGLDKNTSMSDLDLKIKSPNLRFDLAKAATRQSLLKIAKTIIYNALEKGRIEVFKDIGVACFSNKHNDILMWSYYSDGHRGFCLEFDTIYEPFNKSLYSVQYIPTSPIIDHNKLLSEEDHYKYIIQLFLATKYIDWGHEGEWRVILKEKNKEYIYEPKALSGVYFGEKIDPTNLEIISQIVKGQNPNVKLYKMQKNPREFKMIRQEIS